MVHTKNQPVISWIDEMTALTTPDNVVWIDGGETQYDALRKEALSTGELIPLPNDCYLHRTEAHDVARVENRTFICCQRKEDAGPTNNWMEPTEMYAKLKALYAGCMAGRTMYVIPYSMGVVGSPFAKYGIELTDSIYVVLSMAIMTRVGTHVLEALGDNPEYVKGLHAKANLNPEERYIVQFPEDDTIMSVNSGYGGNVLQGKKCFALRIASYLARNQGWMAEHMLILGIQNPKGEVRYLAAAFPSACGKTNLAMLVPPEAYREAGWKVWCVGDDIAWIRRGEDGRLWAMNPENGFFGVAPGTNQKSNPNALETTKKGTIFTNVAHDLDKNSPWWEGLDKNPPENAIDWLGQPWNGKESTEKGAHPNSRFTAPAANCPCLSPEFENPQGVPLSAIVFGGRRAKSIPLVYQSRSWEHGVFVGSIMASETTAAAAGVVGIARRDPMAMLPFCGYNMGDYFQHWLDMGKVAIDLPKIFHVNWFRTDDDDHFMWPGFGENIRVLEWMMKRCFDEVDAQECPIGYVPHSSDLNLEGTDVSEQALEQLLAINIPAWQSSAEHIKEFYDKFDGTIPQTLWDEWETLKGNLQ